jgi:hypothetical protein
VAAPSSRRIEVLLPSAVTYEKAGLAAAGTRASGASYEAIVLRPSADVTDGTWTTDTGGSDLTSVLDEILASDADYVKSAESPVSADIATIALAASSDPTSSAGHIVRYRYGKDAAGGDQIDLTVRLMQGAATIASWSHTNIADGWTQADQTLSGAEADAITNYSDLRVRLEAVKP